MFVPFDSLTEEAKVWVYPSNRKFYKEEVPEITEKVKEFVQSWKGNDEEFKASFTIKYDRFIIFAAEDSKSPLTTPELDAVIAFIFQLQTTYEVELLDKMNVCFKQGEFVQYKEIKAFKKLLKNKSVSKTTVVFDHLIQTKFDLENYWEVPITESWYNRFL